MINSKLCKQTFLFFGGGGLKVQLTFLKQYRDTVSMRDRTVLGLGETRKHCWTKIDCDKCFPCG